jgi:hypothetical protein
MNQIKKDFSGVWSLIIVLFFLIGGIIGWIDLLIKWF